MIVTLQPRRARPFFARHPWVLAPSIARVEGSPEAGAEVDVVSHEGVWIARGLYNPDGLIRVRLYRWDPGPLDAEFWRAKVGAAVALRRDLLGDAGPGSARRLIFSEGDGLSGLTVDRYGPYLSAQVTSRAILARLGEILPILVEATGAEGVGLRSEKGMAQKEKMHFDEGPAFGSLPDGPVEVVEGGVSYLVDLRVGHKTGFYLDQRDNRVAAARLAAGRRVLDLFCYSGGFGLTALKLGGAAHVLGFDASGPAVELARRNAVANGLGAARFEVADAFEALESLRGRGERFGMVVLDPPKFARDARSVDDALKAYLRVNRAAVDVLEPGGVLVTCSCTGHVDARMFAGALNQVAELSGRPIQVIERRGQAADHPVMTACPESEYLKCFLCRVG